MGKKRGGERPNDGRAWMTTAEAARMVGLSEERFRERAKESRLTRFRPLSRRLTHWFLREEIESWAEFVKLRRQWRETYRRFPGKPQVEKIDLAVARATFISSSEAAGLLDISLSTLAGLVRRGRLFCYQTRPGQKGSRLWFSRRAVEQLKEDAQRLKRRAGYQRGRRAAEMAQAEKDAGGTTSTDTPDAPYGEWLTAQQVAAWLGVYPTRVHELRRKGRLRGEHLPRKYRGQRPWYFHRADVEALLADSGYQKFRAAYEAANTPERREQREAERFLKLAEWTLRVNGWDDPDHVYDYQAWPGDVW